MADSEDLIGKADALMARHRPGRAGGEPISGIPVLQEVVDLAPASDDVPVLTEMVEVGVHDLPLPAPTTSASVAAELPHEQQAAALSQNLRSSLLAALQPEIDSLIEERLKQSLEPLVERLFNDLRDDLQSIARDTLRDAITTAVESEIGRRRSGA